MGLFGMDDPARLGALILFAVAITGAVVISLVLRAPAGFWLTIFAKRQADAVTPNRQSLPDKRAKTDLTGEKSGNKRFDLDAQWDRYASRLNDAIAAGCRASRHHVKAITQLDAAEFAVSELFREYPGARNNLNPVIYAEFPALKLPEPADNSEDKAQKAANC